MNSEICSSTALSFLLGVRQVVYEWKNGDWNYLWSQYLAQGKVGWARGWGPENYYAGAAEWASGDGYYWSNYERDSTLCRSCNDDGLCSIRGCLAVCQNRNFVV